MRFLFFQVVFRKIADLKRERELAETRKNEGLDQISSDHPVRKLISKFRKISQENRAAAQTNTSATTSSSKTAPTNSSQPQSQPSSLPIIPETIIQPASAEPTDSSPTSHLPSSTSSASQLLQLPHSSTNKRDKLETISERIESIESQTSQITSVNQSPPLQRPLRSSKWRWLKSDSIEPDKNATKKLSVPNPKPPLAPQQQQTTNPFDSNLSDDDGQSKLFGSDERKPSIPLSLFIPRAARRDSTRTSDDGTDDQVNDFTDFLIYFSFCLN